MPIKVNTSELVIDENELNNTEDNRPTVVKVDHVSMVFNMASEQLNSLKEYAIKLIKHELFFKGFSALDDVSFEVKKGDVFGILGTNGSGKSTMMKLIAGVMEPTKGSCEVKGTIAPLIELGAGFDSDLSARENIYLNGALLGYSKKFIDDHFDEIVDFAEIKDFLDMPLKNYSSGMVARIAFAIATVIVPDVLLVDEVLSVGDFMFQKKCEDRINKLIEEHNVTVLIVSHSNEQIARMCNKAIWIEKGHTRLIGDAKTVCSIYGGLGGRTGSPEAEQRVFQAIKHSMSLKENETQNIKKVIAADNHYSANVKLIRDTWKNNPINTVVLACDNTHVNAIVANTIASFLCSPILPVQNDSIPEPIEHFLQINKPKTIVICSHGCDANELEKLLKELPWNPTVNNITSESSHLKYSLKVSEKYAHYSNSSGPIALVGFDDNPESLTTMSYTYSRKIPTLLLDNQDMPMEQVAEAIKALNGDKLLLFGPQAVKWYDDSDFGIVPAEKIGFRESSNTCTEITEYFLNNSNTKTETLLLAPLALGTWPELISCGSAAATLDSHILLIDQTNLENISANLDLIHNYSPSQLMFIGGNHGLTEADQNLFCAELLSSKL